MSTPYFLAYPTIGGLMMGSLAIECFEYADLTRAADLRGEDVTIEGEPGRKARGRIADDSHRIIELRLRGSHNDDNAELALSTAGKISQYYAHLESVRALAAVQAAQAATFTVGAESWTGSITVERMSAPTRLNPWTYELALDLTVHGGLLTKAA